MSEQPSFETRLSNLLNGYASGAPIEVDAAGLARTIAHRSKGTVRIVGRTFAKPRWLVPLLLAILVLALMIGTIWVGAQLLRDHAPTFRPLAIRATAFMTQQREGATAVRLQDGRVLIIGGRNGFAGGNLSFAEIYDPRARTFEPTGDAPPVNLEGQAATVLRDGRVIVTGGVDDAGNTSPKAVIYDPATAAFSGLEDMASARAGHASVLLRDGRVALIGGTTSVTPSVPSRPAVEYFDPSSMAFTPGPDPPDLRALSPIAYSGNGGRIVVASRGSLFSALLFDPAAGSVKPAVASIPAGLRDARIVGAAELIDGRIAIAVGGVAATGAGSALVVVDPSAGTVSPPAALPGPVVVGPVTLSDGRLLFGLAAANDCTSVLAYVYSVVDAGVTRVGQIGGIGTCTHPPGSTITALADGSALVAGGYMGYGGETSAASLIHP